MKANELMIGDLVDYKGIHHWISRADLDIHRDKWIAEITPIPLTEEILIKNGFPEDAWHGSFPEDNDGLLYIVLSFDKIFWEFNGCRIELKSVHQLQHILRDLGIEKEIEL